MPNVVDDPHELRKAILVHCNDDIVALLTDAEASGLPLEQAVIVVADERDETGRAVAHACSHLGQPLTDANVYVVGLPLDLARDVLAEVDEDLASRLDAAPPTGTAQVICFAEGGVSSMWLGIDGGAARERE